MRNNSLLLTFLLLVFVLNCANSQELDSYIKTKKGKITFTNKDHNNTKKSNNEIFTLNNQEFFGKSFAQKEKHKRYEVQNQTYNNIEIFTANVRINYDDNSNVILYSDNTINIVEIDKSEFPTSDLVSNYSNIKNNNILSSKQIYFPVSESLIIPALEIRYLENNLSYISIFNSDYDIIYNQCLSFDKDMITFPANASVFRPDPVTSAHTVYDENGDFSHNEGATNSSLENEQIDVEIECKKLNDTYYLENNYCVIVTFAKPDWEPVTSTTGDFSYNRSEIGFQQVNAFYHLSEMKKHINGLGFEDAVDYQINVDADAENGDDNSHFTPIDNKQGNLTFGAYAPNESIGIEHVPDAEDAEVVIHEYAHAISHWYSDAGSQSERRCLEEAMADYLAVSYSKAIDDYEWEKIFKWDAHNEYWDGRIATSTKCYSSISYFPSIDYYKYSDVWTAPLMDLNTKLGRETTDKLVLHTISALSASTTMEQAALIMMSMDSVFNNHQNSISIFNTFKEYCILNDGHLAEDNYELSNFNIINSQSFANGGEMRLEFGDLLNGEINIYNINGVNIFNKELNHKKYINLSSEDLNSGIYLVIIKSDRGNKTIKLCKY